MDGGEVHAPHAPHTGHRWFDFAMGGAALLVSAVSLLVAVEHGHTMEKLVQANSLPNAEIQVGVVEGRTPGSAALAITVANSGVGPARIESLEIFHAGQPVTQPDQLVRLLKAAGDAATIIGNVDGESVTGTLVGAGATKTAFKFSAGDGALWSRPMLALGTKLETRICYCSVFDDCYVSDSRVRRGRATRADACPAIKTAFDEDVGALVLGGKPATASPPISGKVPSAGR